MYADGAPKLRPRAARARHPGAGHLLRDAGDGAQPRRPRRGRRGRRVRALRAHACTSTAGCSPDLPAEQSCWMSHRDTVFEAPAGRHRAGLVARSRRSRRSRTPSAGSTASSSTPRWSTPPTARRSSRASSRTSAAATWRWNAASVAEEQIRRIREQVGDGQVICGLSGGVDSSVAALLVHRAVGDQLTCVFVDHGLMRKGEGEQVVDRLPRHFKVPLVAVDAEERFLERLAGRHRARGQAQDHRRRVHPRLRGGGGEARQPASTSSRARSTRT